MHKIGWLFLGLLLLGAGAGVSVAIGSSWAFAVGVLGMVGLAASVAQMEEAANRIETARAIQELVSDRKPTEPSDTTDEPAG